MKMLGTRAVELLAGIPRGSWDSWEKNEVLSESRDGFRVVHRGEPHLRVTSPAPKPGGFGLRLRAKRKRKRKQFRLPAKQKSLRASQCLTLQA
jgi:hypothetical protein